MSNADIVRGLYDNFARGDVPAVLGGMAPDIKWTEAEGFPYGGIYTGPEAVLQNIFMKIGADWDKFAVAPDEVLDAGERTVAFGHYSGTSKATGKSFRVPFAHSWRIKDGKVVEFQQYTDTHIVQQAMR